jgi:hypothetical protein
MCAVLILFSPKIALPGYFLKIPGYYDKVSVYKSRQSYYKGPQIGASRDQK